MYYIRVNTIGKIEEAIVSSPLEILENIDFSLVEITEELFLKVRTQFCYWDNEVIEAPSMPDNYHEFNYGTKQWQPISNYLADIRLENKTTVNNLAGDKILEQYPTYRQMNYNREPLAQATIDMNLWIDGIRAESNVATSSIDLATDLATIEGIVAGFIVYLAGL